MKKVRVDIKETSPGRKFWIFNSSLALWDWIQRCYADPGDLTNTEPSGAFEITLRPGDFMEVEWFGCEILRGVDRWFHLNLVRVGESRPSLNSSGNVVTLHVGWLIDSIVPMTDYDDEHLLVKRCDEFNDGRDLDLGLLFKEQGIEV